MKKFCSLLALLLVMFVLFAGCGRSASSSANLNTKNTVATKTEQSAVQTSNTNISALLSSASTTFNSKTTTGRKININPISTNKTVSSLSYHRGINLGNMLEAPAEGEWGLTVKDEYISLIKAKGFDFVRVPISWSTHQTNGVIDPAFFTRIDHVINVILQNKLGAVIDIHHYNEMNSNPDVETVKLYNMWGQISERYKNLPSSVSFEIMNEPNTKLTTDVWSPIQNKCIQIIRKTNPKRKIVVSAGNWGGASDIWSLNLPDDSNLILSFHYYSPMQFTHQGASWWAGSNQYLGTLWNGTAAEKADIDGTFNSVHTWSQQKGIPVLMGEFGAYSKADYNSRVRWTACVRQTAEKYNFAWSYWEFCSGFGIYNDTTKTFHNELVNALVPVK